MGGQIKQQQTPQLPPYMNLSITGVLIFVGSAVVLFLVVIPGLPLTLILLKELVNIEAQLSAFWGDILLDVAFGALAGLLIGVLRFRRRTRSQVVDELVAATASSQTVTAANIGLACVMLHIVAGALAGLTVGLLGIHAPTEWGTSVIFDTGPIASALAAAGGTGGGLPPSFEDTLPLLFAITVMIILITVFASVFVHGSLAIVVSNAASGAFHGLGQAVGMASVIALTRLWTSNVTEEAIVARKLRPLTLEEAISDFANESSTEPRPLISRYINWMYENGYKPSPQAVVDYFDDWSRFLNERGRGNPPYVVLDFKWYVEHELRRRAPEVRVITADNAPELDGTPATMLYSGWFRRVLVTSMVIGALAGTLQAMMVVAALVLL